MPAHLFRLELPETAPGQQHGLLNQVFSGRALKRQTSCHAQQGRQVRHRGTLKLLLLRGHEASSYRL